MLTANLFAYCYNSPINLIDMNGEKPVYHINSQVSVSNFVVGPRRFNCYGYAINRLKVINPGDLSAWPVNRGSPVHSVADRVIRDMKWTGRTASRVNSPYTYVARGKILIALRITPYGALYDYHFMRKTYGSVWSFKAGNSGPVMELRSGKTPNNVDWDEYAKRNNRYVVNTRRRYTGSIIYIND